MRGAQTEEHLRSAMETRTVIGQAQGIVMERLKTTADHAVALPTRLSQDHDEKVRDVARRLADTGEVPARPQR